ncbi:MAG TPA: helix-turn-helix domain-containing protein [Streptosporangiaceae bacterium]
MTDGAERRVITDARAMRAMAHPVRLALLEAMAVEGTLTATQAAELLGDTPGNMSWHLQTLAKYGFVEEAPGGKGRSRPWRRVAGSNSFDTTVSDPEVAAAGAALESGTAARNLQRLRDWWSVRRSYPVAWRRAAFMNESICHLTAAELAAVSDELTEIFGRYRNRQADPDARPKGALPVRLFAFGHPLTPGSGSSPADS